MMPAMHEELVVHTWYCTGSFTLSAAASLYLRQQEVADEMRVSCACGRFSCPCCHEHLCHTQWHSMFNVP
jgi:hypothetical protein